MWLSPVIDVAPAAEPLLKAAVKEYLRIDDGDASFDGQLDDFIAASRAEVETWTGTRLITQTVTVSADGWAALQSLPVGPVQSVSSVKYIDTLGVEQTLAAEDYQLIGSGLTLLISPALNKSWPKVATRIDAVRVTMVVGYGVSGSDLPGDVYFALLRLIRAKMDDRPLDLFGLLINHRIW